MTSARHIFCLVIGCVVTAWSFNAGAQTVLINEDFQTPLVNNGTANPGIAGWTWFSDPRARRSDVSTDVPCDNYPSFTNQIIQFEYNGDTATRYLTNTWAVSDVYVLYLKASPQDYQNGTLKNIVPSLLETNGTVLWTASALLPDYEADFGRNPWGARKTFSWVIDASSFSSGTPGTAIALKVESSGTGRGVYFDDVNLALGPLGNDTTAPTPNAMTWAVAPAVVDNTNSAMECTFATDDFPYGVQHYFENTNTGANSGWRDGVYSHRWGETNLPPGSTNSYRCKARDKSPNTNETAWSTVVTVVIPAPDTTPPEPDPMTWAVEPMVVDSLNIYMQATTAVDARYGVQYLFENVTTATNSGWQPNTIWSETCQAIGTPLTYRVKARDTSPQTNETAWSAEATLTIPTPSTPGLLIDASFQMPVHANGALDPFYPGWSYPGSDVKSRNAANSADVPGDWPSMTNRVLHFELDGSVVSYDTCHAWGEDYIYTLTLNASPTEWSGQNQRYVSPSIREVSSGTVLWSTNIALPLYTSDFARVSWPAELTFSNQVTGVDFIAAGGTEGELLRVRITHSGTRGVYLDNIHLTSFIPPPAGTLLILR